MNIDFVKAFYFKYRILICPTLVGISSLILIVFIIYPQILKLISNNEALNGVLAKNKNLEVKASQLENINDGELNQNLNLSLAALPMDKDLAGALGEVQSLVNQSGFNLLSLSVGSGNDVGEFNGFNVKAEVEGSQVLLASLLTTIESSGRIMKVSSVELNRLSIKESVNAVVTIEVFYSPIPTTLGAIDSPLPKVEDKDKEVLANLAAARGFSGAVVVTSGDLSVPVGKSNPFE